MDLGLEGKTVIVSGVTGAIGESICEGFLREGAAVVALHRGGEERLGPFKQRLKAEGVDVGRLTSVEADITDAEACEAAIGWTLERHDRIDVLVNNAGATLERPFLATTEEEARRLTEVNLWGAVRLTRLVLRPMLLARSGAVVAVTSVLASRGGRGASVYASSKAALEALTRSLAIEMAPKGIRLNAVAPGVIETSMSARLRRRRAVSLLDRVPMGRVGTPSEVTPAVLLLASERAASYITGQVVVVDGGIGL